MEGVLLLHVANVSEPVVLCIGMDGRKAAEGRRITKNKVYRNLKMGKIPGTDKIRDENAETWW